MRQVHWSNILVRQYHAIGGEVKLVSMLQEGDIVELRETPVLDHSTSSGRDRAAGVDKVISRWSISLPGLPQRPLPECECAPELLQCR